jgi:hypothetical protein
MSTKIPGTRYRVDAFDKKHNIIYEYHENAFHGFPPDHKQFLEISPMVKQPNQTLYIRTMERMQFIKKKQQDLLLNLSGGS